MVQRHIAVLRRYNVLPVVATYHGGFTSWASFVNCGLCRMTAPLLGGGSREFAFQRPPLGARAGPPCYLADLQRDYGLTFLLSSGAGLPASASASHPTAHALGDGTPCYVLRTLADAGKSDPRIPFPSLKHAHGENAGSNIACFLAQPARFGESRCLYTHFNMFNREVFEPPAAQVIQMGEVKRFHPYAEAGFKLLSNAMYDLDHAHKFYQRMWACPISVLMRFQQVNGRLAEHTTLDGDSVRVVPWKDEVSGQVVPDPRYLTQDLHGQTFYVPDSTRARVFVGEAEVTALKRNPADFTGRPSVTVVDTHAPTVVFDEVDFYEQNGRVIPKGASYFFRRRGACCGDYCCEVQVEKPGGGDILWNPVFLNSHETGYLHFAYRKTNPKSKVSVAWGPQLKPLFVAGEGPLRGEQGWQLPYFEDTAYHEVVVDYADMQSPAQGEKHLPRGPVGVLALGLREASPGDSVFFDKVEFLAARGVRPDAGHGLVVGGQLTPRLDGQVVTLTIDGKARTAVTHRGGWYIFTDVPDRAVAQITYEDRGVQYYPARGRLVQIGRNDLEYHIYATDPRAPSLPRPPGFVESVCPPELMPASENSAESKDKYDATYAPHSRRFYAGTPKGKLCYLVEDYVNNFGFIDRDRRVENPDNAVRILLQGECWTEGQQTTTNLHMNVVLESLLRRRTGVPVEVLVTATSSSTPASWSLTFEKYGNRFQPDLVLLFLNSFNMTHLEPTLLKKLIGWDKEHAALQDVRFRRPGRPGRVSARSELRRLHDPDQSVAGDGPGAAGEHLLRRRRTPARGHAQLPAPAGDPGRAIPESPASAGRDVGPDHGLLQDRRAALRRHTRLRRRGLRPVAHPSPRPLRQHAHQHVGPLRRLAQGRLPGRAALGARQPSDAGRALQVRRRAGGANRRDAGIPGADRKAQSG